MSQIGICFPGQGSQSVGMLHRLAVAFPVILETFEEASDVLQYDVWSLSQNGPVEALNHTVRTQPLLLTASVAMWRLWGSLCGHLPELMAGHSLGEYSALVCSNVLAFHEALQLVEERGRLMQAAYPVGSSGMAAIIGLTDEEVTEGCRLASRETGQIVEAVNFNAPGQVVIAGKKEAVEQAAIVCYQLGAKRALLLPISVPAHASIMRGIAEQFRIALTRCQFSRPEYPVIHNADLSCRQEGTEIQKLLVAQLYQPVRWVATIRRMVQGGTTHFLEMGPGSVLTGLLKRIAPECVGYALHLPETFRMAAACSDIGGICPHNYHASL